MLRLWLPSNVSLRSIQEGPRGGAGGALCPSHSPGRAQEPLPGLLRPRRPLQPGPEAGCKRWDAARAPLTHLSLAPRPLWALLFCAHLVSQVARGTPAPQATVAASASAGMAKDPCSLQPPALLRAKGCPGLEVTWPEEEVPLSKEQFLRGPRRAGCGHRGAQGGLVPEPLPPPSTRPAWPSVQRPALARSLVSVHRMRPHQTGRREFRKKAPWRQGLQAGPSAGRTSLWPPQRRGGPQVPPPRPGLLGSREPGAREGGSEEVRSGVITRTRDLSPDCSRSAWAPVNHPTSLPRLATRARFLNPGGWAGWAGPAWQGGRVCSAGGSALQKGQQPRVSLDGTLTLSCTACSRFPHFSILYWLGNGSFIERLPGRLREGSIR